MKLRNRGRAKAGPWGRAGASDTPLGAEAPRLLVPLLCRREAEYLPRRSYSLPSVTGTFARRNSLYIWNNTFVFLPAVLHCETRTRFSFQGALLFTTKHIRICNIEFLAIARTYPKRYKKLPPMPNRLG